MVQVANSGRHRRVIIVGWACARGILDKIIVFDPLTKQKPMIVERMNEYWGDDLVWSGKEKHAAALYI